MTRFAILFQFGGSDGDAATCLTRAEPIPSPDDVKLGEIGAAPLYMNVTLYERWGRPTFVIDVAPGAAGSLSLEGLEDVHFVIRMPREASVTG